MYYLVHKIVYFLQEPRPRQGLLFKIVAKSVASCPGPWFLGSCPSAPRPSPGPGALCGIAGWDATASYATPPT